MGCFNSRCYRNLIPSALQNLNQLTMGLQMVRSLFDAQSQLLQSLILHPIAQINLSLSHIVHPGLWRRRRDNIGILKT